jgi:hypothetical protein
MIRTLAGTVLLFLLLVFLPSALQSQFRLLIGKPDFTYYPKISIPFELLDNTATLDTLTAQDLLLWEDSERMLPIEIECGDLQSAQKINFFFLMDVSYSMAFREGTNNTDWDSVKWRTAKSVFIQGFQKLRPEDEGALASFAGDFLLEQTFTTNKKLLADAAAAMELRSGTSIYDAIVTASGYLEQQDGKKIIILLTDGVDNRSRNLREQAIAIAWNRGVPVYPIGLGFYPDPNDPGRQDVDTLLSIARGTGGKAFFAPTSEDLEKIFSDIIESIYSIGCVMRYTTPDTCRDGATRTIDLRANVKGTVIDEKFTYTMQDLRSRLSLSLGFPGSTLSSGQSYSVPVMGSGELRAGEASSFEVVLRYDPSVVEIMGFDDAGTVLDPSGLSLTEPVFGELHITGNNIFPRRGVMYGTPDAIFALDVRVLQRFSIDTTQFELSVPSMQQICEVIPDASGATIIVHGCPSDIALGFDSTIVAAATSDVRIPLLLPSMLDPGQDLSFELYVDYDADLFEYRDFSLEGGLAENLDVSVTPVGSTLHIIGSGGRPVAGRDLLMMLRFYVGPTKNASPVAFRLRDATLTQMLQGMPVNACRPLITIFGARLYADGICSPLLKRRDGPVLEAGRPHPITAESPSTTLFFSVTGDASIRLEILDEFGRVCSVLADGIFAKGRYSASWSPAALPNGLYLAVLRDGAEVRTQKILVTR